MPTALAPGIATIAVINAGRQTDIPLRVAIASSGTATIGADGGAVQGSDGSLLTVGPGTLTSDTTVAIAPLQQTNLSLGIPDAFDSCPSRFNPFDLDSTGFVSQSSTCSCTVDRDCGGGDPGQSYLRMWAPGVCSCGRVENRSEEICEVVVWAAPV